MHPVLLSVGPIKIYSYGLVGLIAFMSGLFWWWKIGKEESWPEEAVFDAWFGSYVVYLLAGRWGWWLTQKGELSWWQYFAWLSHPGLQYSWGFGVVVVWLLVWARKEKLNIWRVWDAWASVVMGVIGLGWLGAWLGGEVGSDWRWALLGMGWFLVGFGVLMRVRKNFRFYEWYKGKRGVARDGLVTWLAVMWVGGYYVLRGWWQRKSQSWYGGGGMVLGALIMIGIWSGYDWQELWKKIKGKEWLGKLGKDWKVKRKGRQ